jgi:hypothetical protein
LTLPIVIVAKLSIEHSRTSWIVIWGYNRVVLLVVPHIRWCNGNLVPTLPLKTRWKGEAFVPLVHRGKESRHSNPLQAICSEQAKVDEQLVSAYSVCVNGEVGTRLDTI